MIQVHPSVLEGLEAARDSGKYNMFDRNSVMLWLIDNGYRNAALWVYENKSLYARGILEGFEVEKE